MAVKTPMDFWQIDIASLPAKQFTQTAGQFCKVFTSKADP